jgi:hypothetical protein
MLVYENESNEKKKKDFESRLYSSSFDFCDL